MNGEGGSSQIKAKRCHHQSAVLVQALREAHQQAVQRSEAGAVRVLAALAHPAWSDAVGGAAAAIASEAAVGACARRLIAEARMPAPLLPLCSCDACKGPVMSCGMKQGVCGCRYRGGWRLCWRGMRIMRSRWHSNAPSKQTGSPMHSGVVS